MSYSEKYIAEQRIMKLKNVIKTAAALVAAAGISMSSMSAGYSAAYFSDTETHWAREYIDKAAELGLTDGMDDGLFHPDDTITNAQFVTMIMRSRYGTMEPVDEKWYSGYMDYALKNLIITDMETANADLPITRQSTARIVHEMADKAYNEPDEDNWTAAEALADLYDCNSCVMHIAQVYVKGIMRGRGDGLFHFTDTLTRAEAVTVIIRLIEPELRTPPRQKEDSEILITAEKAFEMMEKGAVLMDVRAASDYAEGHIKGSISMPIDNITADPRTAFADLDPEGIIIVYCRRGTNSRRAAAILGEAGYTNVYNLGGIEDGEYELITE